MDYPTNYKRILKGNPYIFKNTWLCIKSWNQDIRPNKLSFNLVPTWVQIWNLPPKIKSTKIRVKIGVKLDEVLSSTLFIYPKKVTLVKVKILLDVTRPLRQGMHIGSTKDGITWVD